MRRVVVAAGLLASLVLASNAYAIPVYGTVDDLVASYDKDTDCSPLTLPSCEEKKLEAFLGSDYGNLAKIDTNNGAGWSYVNDNDASTNLVAFNLGSFGFLSPIAAFAVKIGNAVDDIFIFTNNTSTQWALIDLAKITASSGNISISSLSHISTLPEPASLLLIGVGAATAAAVRRKQRSRQGQVISRA